MDAGEIFVTLLDVDERMRDSLGVPRPNNGA
jgi:hypothetical protein